MFNGFGRQNTACRNQVSSSTHRGPQNAVDGERHTHVSRKLLEGVEHVEAVEVNDASSQRVIVPVATEVKGFKLTQHNEHRTGSMVPMAISRTKRERHHIVPKCAGSSGLEGCVCTTTGTAKGSDRAEPVRSRAVPIELR